MRGCLRRDNLQARKHPVKTLSPKSLTLVVLVSGLILIGGTLTIAVADALATDFQHPPDSARPWVYWFPLDGNITSNGITADLEAMQRVGIGGVLIMEVDQGTPTGPASFAGPLWRELFKHICAEANRLGLEVNMNNDAGWCGSGGPGSRPDWPCRRSSGPRRTSKARSISMPLLPQPKAVANYYRDIAVLAFPTPADDYASSTSAAKSA